MSVCAVVPQKPLALAKSRLRAVLSPEARARLSLALLQTVCTAVRAARGVEDILVVTADPTVRDAAARYGVRAVPDPAPDLNQALVDVFRSLPTRSHAVLVVSADLPLLRPSDIAAILEAGDRRTLALAPARDGIGTNALLLPPAVGLRPAFGPASLVVHRDRARAWGLRVAEVRRPGLAVDLDTPADLAALRVAQAFNSLSVPVTM